MDDCKEQNPTIYAFRNPTSPEALEVMKLKEQINFLVESFTFHDAVQRTKMESLEATNNQLTLINQQLNTRLAYFQGMGHGGPEQ